MSVLKYAKRLHPSASDEDALKFYVLMKDAQLETDTVQRLYGIPNHINTGKKRAGYQKLREFFEGDQFQEVRSDGSSMRTHNQIRSAVLNYTAFLANEEPTVDIPPRDRTDDVEVERVKQVEEHVKDVFDDNGFGDEFEMAVQCGSAVGDSMLIGPFWDPEEKRITFTHVEYPEHIRIIWADENFKRKLGVIIHLRLSPEEVMEKYGDKLRAKGINDLRYGTPDTTTPAENNENTQRLVTVLHFLDDEHSMIIVDNHSIEFVKHDDGFIPLVHVPNIPNIGTPWGTSDSEDMLDPQVEYNESISDQSDILKQVAFPTVFGANLEVAEIQAGIAKIYDLGDEAKVFPDPRNTNFPFLQTFLNGRKQDLITSSGLNELFAGGSQNTFQATGRALSVIMQPITNKVKSRQRRWKSALAEFVKNILILTEKHVEGGKALVDGHYKCDVFFPATLTPDITDEINKFNTKLQSLTTTQKNIGIASPKDEQDLMKKELADPELMPEISKIPALRIQQQQAEEAAKAAKQQPGPAGGGAPTLTTSENVPGENPMPAPGAPSRLPPEAMQALLGSRTGAPPVAPPR